MRSDERLSAILSELAARHDRVLALRPPTDDVPDFMAGYNAALADVWHILTTNSEGTS